MRITQLGSRTADSFLRTSIVPCTFPSVFTQTCLPNHCLRIDVIIVGVSSSASLILVPAKAVTARRRRIYSVDVARCQVCTLQESFRLKIRLSVGLFALQSSAMPSTYFCCHNQLFERLLAFAYSAVLSPSAFISCRLSPPYRRLFTLVMFPNFRHQQHPCMRTTRPGRSARS